MTTNPSLAKLEWKPAMVARYEKFTDVAALKKYSTSYLRKAIRVNTIKTNVETVVARLKDEWHLEPVPWCPEGFWITHKKGIRTDIGNLLEHALGYIYIQDPASMIPPLVLRPQPGDTVLDMCAAPGSKTTQMAALMNNEGVIVANDVAHQRLAALGINIQRMGVLNAIVTQNQGQRITGIFDKILLDAPCSATGTIRRSGSSLRMWSLPALQRISSLQRTLLGRSWKLLKPGGVMVYSTCSLEPEENEMVVHEFVSKNVDASVIPFELKISSPGTLTSFEGVTFLDEVKNCLRIFPQDNDCEGFFVAKLQKSL